jgi:MFS family permease
MTSVPAVETPARTAGAKQAWVLILAMFLPIMAIIALAPALPTLFDRFKDVPHAATLVPMLLTAPSFCIAVFGGVAGYLTDRFGRRNLLLGAMLLYFLAGTGPFFFQSFPAVLASRFVLGIAEAFVLSIGNALLADYFAKNDQHRWLTVQGAVGPFLATLVLALSGQLAALGWRFPFLLYTATVPIGLFGFLYLFEPERKITRTIEAIVTPFPVLLVASLCAVTLVTSIIYFVQTIQFSLVLREIGVRDPALIGRVSAVASLAVPIGALVFKRNVRYRIQIQLALTFLIMGTGLTIMGISRDYRLTTAASFFGQIATGMTVPTLVAWALSVIPVEHRGRGMGFWAASFFIGQFLSPLCVSGVRELTGGLLAAVACFGAICLSAAIVCLISAVRPRTASVTPATL